MRFLDPVPFLPSPRWSPDPDSLSSYILQDSALPGWSGGSERRQRRVGMSRLRWSGTRREQLSQVGGCAEEEGCRQSARWRRRILREVRRESR